MFRRFNLHPYPYDTRHFGGGGGPSSPPPPPPPIKETGFDARLASREQKRFRKKRSSRARSLIAGETGGFAPAGTKNLLGE